jgi:hypothetical protein
MASSRYKFNWSILDREGLVEYFFSLYSEIEGVTYSVNQFHTKLSRHIKKLVPVRIAKLRSNKVDPGWVWVGGVYYSDRDQVKHQCIELNFSYNLFDEEILMPRRRFYRMCITMADTLLHEIMHMRQYRRRKFKDLPDYASTAAREEKRREQEYLGNSDEIDAYSFNIACELIDKFGNKSKNIVNYLNENQKGHRRRHSCWIMYLKAFDYDHNHPIVRRVKSKVIRYIPHALQGKPYRNSDWINR